MVDEVYRSFWRNEPDHHKGLYHAVQLKSRMRSALSPWLDRRAPLDVIRDRLEERAIMLSRQAELAPLAV